MSVREGPLGRLPAADDAHIRKYGLVADAVPEGPTPVVLGINWDRSYDAPTKDKDGSYWIGRTPAKGIRGGHAIALRAPQMTEPETAWDHFDQGVEGSCVGWAWSRASALMENRLFDGFSLYERAKQIDAFPGEDYSGTEVRAGGKVCQTEGLWLVRGGKVAKNPGARWKIGAYFWATTVEQICACLHVDPSLGYVEASNSWKRGYPYIFRIPLEEIERRVFQEDGDAAIAINTPRKAGLAA